MLFRLLARLVLAALGGSILAVAALFIVMPGQPSDWLGDPFLPVLIVPPLFFTFPGAFLMMGIEARLSERSLQRPVVIGLVCMAGLLIGGAITLFILSSAIGALYGFSTALCWTLARPLTARAPTRS